MLVFNHRHHPFTSNENGVAVAVLSYFRGSPNYIVGGAIQGGSVSTISDLRYSLTIESTKIPTLSQWSLNILGMLPGIFGIVAIRQRLLRTA